MAKQPPYANVAFYLADKRVERRLVRPDGTVEYMQVNPMPLKRKMVDPAGFVVEVSLTSARNIKQLNTDNTYGIAVMYGPQKLPTPDWLPFYECPIAKGHVPAMPGETPCPQERESLTDEQRLRAEMANPDKPCCEHLRRVILARQAKRATHEAEFGESIKNNNQKLVEMVASQAALLSKMPTAPAGNDDPPEGGAPLFGGKAAEKEQRARK